MSENTDFASLKSISQKRWKYLVLPPVQLNQSFHQYHVTNPSLSSLVKSASGRPICCMLELRWRTVTASDHSLLILLRSNNWCMNIYILMIYH